MENWKIIKTDNLNLDYPPNDILICENFKSEQMAIEICNMLNINDKCSDMYYSVVSQDYKLYVFDGEY